MNPSRGALLFARNSEQIDYIKQAFFLAKRIKKYIGIPTTIATDCVDYLKQKYDTSVFDNIIELDHLPFDNRRFFRDGAMASKRAPFKNLGRADAYNLSPYDETLLLDTDYIISNSLLKNCFDSRDDFLIYKDSEDIAKVRDEREFDHISELSVDFYWATVVFFRKTKENKIFFDLVKHIQEEYNHYRRIYQISSNLFRNDFAFSIAIHMMNGFQPGDFAKPLPGKMLYTTDRDILWEIKDDEMMFLVEKKNYLGEYTPIKTKGQTIHVMNKFSLIREIDKELFDD